MRVFGLRHHVRVRNKVVTDQSTPFPKKKEWNKIDHLIPRTKHPLKPQLKRPKNYDYTFSDTLLLLPLSNSGAIHGRVPLTPPETRVFLFILDKPKSPTCIEIINSPHEYNAK